MGGLKSHIGQCGHSGLFYFHGFISSQNTDTFRGHCASQLSRNERLTFVIMMSIGYSMGRLLSGCFIVLLVRLATQALIAFITAATMTNTAEWNCGRQNASI